MHDAFLQLASMLLKISNTLAQLIDINPVFRFTDAAEHRLRDYQLTHQVDELIDLFGSDTDRGVVTATLLASRFGRGLTGALARRNNLGRLIGGRLISRRRRCACNAALILCNINRWCGRRAALGRDDRNLKLTVGINPAKDIVDGLFPGISVEHDMPLQITDLAIKVRQQREP